MIRFLAGLLLLFALTAAAPPEPAAIVLAPSPGAIVLAGAPILVDPADDAGVRDAARNLSADFTLVTGRKAALAESEARVSGTVIIAGTIGRSRLIDRLAREGRLDLSGVKGRWEASVTGIVERPLPGVARALVLAGADRRGTIFAIYDLSRQIGVSPWHWWADVPPAHHEALYALSGRRVEAPAVKYRGIFINDEDPALLGWAKARFGGFNHAMYAHVFELILRLRGNLLWPAMWGKSFYEDDPENARLANEMGVVIGTSHHEPLMRAHVDWQHHGEGSWDYATNGALLRAFWREGMERTNGDDRVVTVGMRGDGDKPMTQGTATGLLERIVADQRGIIAETTGRPAADTPQVWALYKEVQDYYDAGMRVPDDVTLLFSDDNWGNLRRLPSLGADRAGGYGIYYHFDYVGGPRNYKWIDTVQVERVWEQMQLAYAYGARQLWIVNVGDIKPMEYPTSFFLDFAWNPAAWPLERLGAYPAWWAGQQFGPAHAGGIGALLARYGRLAARRKPELLGSETYCLETGEWDRVIGEWRNLAADAGAIERTLPAEDRDAYFELVLHPILAFGNLHALYQTVALNRLHAAQGRADTNDLAAEARRLFDRDREIRRRYEEQIAGGKWTGMMAQTHIGYTDWQQPDRDVMPDLRMIAIPAAAAMGVAVDGSDAAWPGGTGTPALPVFDRFGDQTRRIEIFDHGAGRLDYRATASAPWILIDRAEGRVGPSTSLAVRIDWRRAPRGTGTGEILIAGSDGARVRVAVTALDPAERPSGFVESGGQVAIEAEHHLPAAAIGGVAWRTIPNLGRTLSGVAAFPMTAPPQPPGKGAHLDYPITLLGAGEAEIRVFVSPDLDFRGGAGLRYAVSVDDGPAQVVDIDADPSPAAWDRAVADNIRVGISRVRIGRAGAHIVHLWRVDPGIVFQRLLVARSSLPPSALGPPESPRF